jgi:hypothetical protein
MNNNKGYNKDNYNLKDNIVTFGNLFSNVTNRGGNVENIQKVETVGSSLVSFSSGENLVEQLKQLEAVGQLSGSLSSQAEKNHKELFEDNISADDFSSLKPVQPAELDDHEKQVEGPVEQAEGVETVETVENRQNTSDFFKLKPFDSSQPPVEGEEDDDEGEETCKENRRTLRGSWDFDKIEMPERVNKHKFPFLSDREVEEYISDINACLDNPYKIFLHQFWENLMEYFDGEDVCDEHGNLIEEIKDISAPIGKTLDSEYVDRSIKNALEETEYILKDGYLDVNDEPLSVETDIPFSTVKAEIMIDWERVATVGNRYFVNISLRCIRKIWEELESRPNREKYTPEERAKNVEVMNEIVRYGNDKKLRDKLTPIEKAIYGILVGYLLPDGVVDVAKIGYEVDAKHKRVGVDAFRMFMRDLKKEGVREEDFLKCLSYARLRQGETLLTNRNMWNCESIRYWNKIYGFFSAILA